MKADDVTIDSEFCYDLKTTDHVQKLLPTNQMYPEANGYSNFEVAVCDTELCNVAMIGSSGFCADYGEGIGRLISGENTASSLVGSHRTLFVNMLLLLTSSRLYLACMFS